MGQFLFACSSTEYYRFTSAKPETYQKAVAKAEPVNTVQENTASAVEATAISAANAQPEAEPILEASTKTAEPVLFETKRTTREKVTPTAAAPVLTVEENTVLESVKGRLATMTKAEKKEFKKEVKEALRGTNDAADVVKIILAILIPPLAVFLHEGLNSRFWISLLLTLLFVLPGIIYALLVVTDTI